MSDAELSATVDRAIRLAGASARSESEIGHVTGIATAEALDAALRETGASLAEGDGIIGA
ncbi:MAG: hypothetical protein ABEH59_06940 [Halobacteriales archaeon]